MRIAAGVVLAAAMAVGLFLPVAAQIQNPIGAAKDAWKKARQEQQQRQQQKQQSQQPAAAPAPAKTPSAPQGSSQPVTLSDLEKPDGRVQMADWKTMPDIVGIHLHMPLEAAVARLKEQYPKLRFQPWLHNPLPLNIPQKQLTGGISVNYGGGGFADQINVNVTQTPNAHVVWQATRFAERQNLNRTTLLAALREKYGKETFAEEQSSYVELRWLFDEQGRRIAAPSGGLTVVSPCAGRGVTGITPGVALDQSFLEFTGPTANPWCASSYVGIYVQLQSYGDPEIVDTIRAEMMNVPLAARAAKITAAWKNAEMEKIRQQEIENSKRVKPKL